MPELGDVEDALGAALRPGERVLWTGRADRSPWRRVGAFAFGCMPVVAFAGFLAVVAAEAGVQANRRALSGTWDRETIRAFAFGGVFAALVLAPWVAGELALRRRRYVVTTARALVVTPAGVHEELELSDEASVELSVGFVDTGPTGVAVRARGEKLVFAALGDPHGARLAIQAALEAAR